MLDKHISRRSHYASSVLMTKTHRLRTFGEDSAAVLRRLGMVRAGKFVLRIGFGVLAVSYGFTWWFAPLISFTMYAGSVE